MGDGLSDKIFVIIFIGLSYKIVALSVIAHIAILEARLSGMLTFFMAVNFGLLTLQGDSNPTIWHSSRLVNMYA